MTPNESKTEVRTLRRTKAVWVHLYDNETREPLPSRHNNTKRVEVNLLTCKCTEDLAMQLSTNMRRRKEDPWYTIRELVWVQNNGGGAAADHGNRRVVDDTCLEQMKGSNVVGHKFTLEAFCNMHLPKAKKAESKVTSSKKQRLKQQRKQSGDDEDDFDFYDVQRVPSPFCTRMSLDFESRLSMETQQKEAPQPPTSVTMRRRTYAGPTPDVGAHGAAAAVTQSLRVELEAVSAEDDDCEGHTWTDVPTPPPPGMGTSSELVQRASELTPPLSLAMGSGTWNDVFTPPPPPEVETAAAGARTGTGTSPLHEPQPVMQKRKHSPPSSQLLFALSAEPQIQVAEAALPAFTQAPAPVPAPVTVTVPAPVEQVFTPEPEPAPAPVEQVFTPEPEPAPVEPVVTPAPAVKVAPPPAPPAPPAPVSDRAVPTATCTPTTKRHIQNGKALRSTERRKGVRSAKRVAPAAPQQAQQAVSFTLSPAPIDASAMPTLQDFMGSLEEPLNAPGRPTLSTLLSQLDFLKQAVGVHGNDEELEWLMASKKPGAFAFAEAKAKAAMDTYVRALAEQSQVDERVSAFNSAVNDLLPVLTVITKLGCDFARLDTRAIEDRKVQLRKVVRTQLKSQIANIQDTQSKCSISGKPPLADTLVKRIMRLGKESELEVDAAAAMASALTADIKAARQSLKDATRSCQTTQTAALEAAEKWGMREKAASDFHSTTLARDREWLEAERKENEQALAKMRSLLPVNVSELSAQALIQAAAAASASHADSGASAREPVVLPLELALELKKNFLLHWCISHEEDIVTANFLTGAQKPIFEAFHVLDIVETRAIAAVLPEQFSFDRDGQKASWRRRFLDRAKQLVNQQKGVPLEGAWDLGRNCRQMVKPPPLSPSLQRRRVYFYPTCVEVQSRLKEYSDKEELLAARQMAVVAAEKVVQECKDELSIIIAEGRDPDMKLTVGAERLGKVKSLAKVELARAEKTRADAAQALGRVKGTISNYMQTEKEYKDFVSKMKSMLLSVTLLTPGVKLWSQRILPDDEKFLVPGAFDAHPVLCRSQRSRAVKGLDLAADKVERQAELDAIRNARRAAASPAAAAVGDGDGDANRENVRPAGNNHINSPGGCSRQSLGALSSKGIQFEESALVPSTPPRTPPQPGAVHELFNAEHGGVSGTSACGESNAKDMGRKRGQPTPGRPDPESRVRVNADVLTALNKMFSGNRGQSSSVRRPASRGLSGSQSKGTVDESHTQAMLVQACSSTTTPLKDQQDPRKVKGDSREITPRSRSQASNKTRSRLLKHLLSVVSPVPASGQHSVEKPQQEKQLQRKDLFAQLQLLRGKKGMDEPDAVPPSPAPGARSFLDAIKSRRVD